MFPPAPTGQAAPNFASGLNLQPQGQPFQQTPSAPPAAQPNPNHVQGVVLDTTSRAKLDGVVQKMQQNGETDQYIQNVVNDFKLKYGTPAVAQRPAIADVGIGAAKTANSFLGQADVLGTMNRLASGDNADVTGNKLTALLNMANPLPTMNALAGKISNWTGGDTSVKPSNTPDYTGMSPAQRQQAEQPSNYAQQVGQTGVIVAANALPFAKEALPAIREVAGNIKEALTPKSTLSDAIANNTPAQVDPYINNYIQTKYMQGIKPSIAGKATSGALEKYQANINSGVKTIIDNKANLQMTDVHGDVVDTKLPQSVEQFRQAIEQTKSAIFQKYDAMASAAGEKGATVDLKPIATELQKVAQNPIVQDLHPDLADYAASRAKTMLSRGSYSASEAQTAIQNLNNSLDAFYRNPSYDTASRAGVDALIANKMRAGLDATIENTQGKGYAGLKSQYGALKAIETDVVKRTIMEARKGGGGGLVSHLGDLASAEELIRGITTLNPHALVTSATLKAIITLRDYLNNPNRAVRLLFEKADQASGATIPSPLQNTGTPQGGATVSPTNPQK